MRGTKARAARAKRRRAIWEGAFFTLFKTFTAPRVCFFSRHGGFSRPAAELHPAHFQPLPSVPRRAVPAPRTAFRAPKAPLPHHGRGRWPFRQPRHEAHFFLPPAAAWRGGGPVHVGSWRRKARAAGRGKGGGRSGRSAFGGRNHTFCPAEGMLLRGKTTPPAPPRPQPRHGSTRAAPFPRQAPATEARHGAAGSVGRKRRQIRIPTRPVG